jgi:hypothetical protein
LAGVLALGVGGVLRARQKSQKQMTSAEIAAATLPTIDAKQLHIVSNRDLEVVDASVESGHIVAGTVRNNTDNPINDATVYFDLTNRNGARLGAVATHIRHIEARSELPFRITAEQQNVAFALVREVRLQ